MKATAFAAAFLSIGIVTLGAFAQGTYKNGDVIYANVLYGGCVRVTVTGTDPAYSVHVEEGTYKDRSVFYNVNRLTECKQSGGGTKTAGDERIANNPNAAAGPAIGTRVDVYLSGLKEGKNRGTIMDKRGSEFKVHYDGCSDKYDVWENAMLVKPAATLDASDPDVRFLVGKWSMNTVAVGGESSGTIAAWGRSAGIQVNADGTYLWYQGGGKAPVKGRWSPHAKIAGARFGTETENGIIVRDAQGGQWKMFRRRSTIDNGDHTTIRMMCQGTTQMGTRVR